VSKELRIQFEDILPVNIENDPTDPANIQDSEYDRDNSQTLNNEQISIFR